MIGIVVMSGGLKANGALPIYCQQRINLAKHVLDSGRDALIVCSSSFSLNVGPKFDASGSIVSEGSVMRDGLINMGVCGNSIEVEQLSHDSVGGVFFSLEFYMYREGIKDVCFITSDFHMDRVKAIANFVNKICFSNCFRLSFLSPAADDLGGIDPTNRLNHEKEAVKSFMESVAGVVDKKSFVRYLMRRHTCYNFTFGGRTVKDEMY